MTYLKTQLTRIIFLSSKREQNTCCNTGIFNVSPNNSKSFSSCLESCGRINTSSEGNDSRSDGKLGELLHLFSVYEGTS